MDFHHIIRQFIDKFSTVTCMCSYHPQYKLMLFHNSDILMHPCRNSTMYIRITAF